MEIGILNRISTAARHMSRMNRLEVMLPLLESKALNWKPFFLVEGNDGQSSVGGGKELDDYKQQGGMGYMGQM